MRYPELHGISKRLARAHPPVNRMLWVARSDGYSGILCYFNTLESMDSPWTLVALSNLGKTRGPLSPVFPTRVPRLLKTHGKMDFIAPLPPQAFLCF